MNRYFAWGKPFSWLNQNYLFLADSARTRFLNTCVDQSSYVRGRVSIPIATYDRIDILIDRTLPALLEQTYPNIEIIVVGDGSPEGKFKRLEGLQDQRLRVVRLRKRQRYPKDLKRMWMVAGSEARNRGMTLATGEWLLWMSDDDLLLPTALETLLASAGRVPGCDVSSGGTLTEAASGDHVVHLPSTANLGFGFPFAGMPAVLVHRKFQHIRWNRWSHLKEWNAPSDYDLFERISRLGVKAAWTDERVARIPLVNSLGLTGSAAFIQEEDLRRTEAAEFKGERS